MCTWAGYVGTQQAAPILLEMAKRQEGLWGAFYSGIATSSNEKLDLIKLVGTMSQLQNKTKAVNLPGTVGLVHSRTNSGGGLEWGQPFIDNNATVAVLGQGSKGLFADDSENIAVGNELLDDGTTFKSARLGKTSKYPVLKNGTSVHSSELVTQAVSRNYAKSANPSLAIRETLKRRPFESVFAFIFHDIPNTIFLANINQRVVIGQDTEGTYLASSAMAFPDTVSWQTELPANTLARITKTSIHYECLLPHNELQIVETMPAKLDSTVLQYLKESPEASLQEIVDNALVTLFESGRLVRRAFAGYRTIERLLASNLIEMKTVFIPGINGENDTPKKVFALRKS